MMSRQIGGNRVVLSDEFKVPRTEILAEYDLAELHEAYSLWNPDL